MKLTEKDHAEMARNYAAIYANTAQFYLHIKHWLLANYYADMAKQAFLVARTYDETDR